MRAHSVKMDSSFHSVHGYLHEQTEGQIITLYQEIYYNSFLNFLIENKL